jgi:hypothetical protein
MKEESWEGENSIQNQEATIPHIINNEKTSEGENYSYDWPVPLE